MSKKKVFQISNALVEGLKETVSVGNRYSGELAIEAIPLRRIELDPENPRELHLNLSDLPQGPLLEDPAYEIKLRDKHSLQTMVSSIQRDGIINPIILYRLGDKYRLIAGERRVLASLIAGKEDIPARILDRRPSELKLNLLQWAENIEREDLTLWERLRNLKRLIQAYQTENNQATSLTPVQLSQLIGCSLTHAMNYHAILNEENIDFKKAIENNSIKNLEKAALIARITDVTIKNKALTECIAGVTLKQLKHISEQKNISKVLEQAKNTKKRGREATRVNLGATKNPRVVKHIMDNVMNAEPYSNMKKLFSEVDWKQYDQITQAFKQFLSLLEKQIP